MSLASILRITAIAFLLLMRVVVAQAPANSSAKLPGDTLTLTEAKVFLQAHESEKAKLEDARKAVFKQGVKSTPAERAKLIQSFRATQKDRIQAIQANTARARELDQKVKEAEKSASPGKPSGS